jgi:cytochrome P450
VRGVRTLVTRIAARLARHRLRVVGVNGFDLSKVGMLPDETLMPLRREGLHPVAALGAAREAAPVSRLPAPFGLKVWLVSGYHEARQVLADSAAYSTDFAHLAGAAAGSMTPPGGLGFADPPVHTRLRKLLTPEFTMRRLARLTPRVEAIVAERLDAMRRSHGPVDLVTEFALPVPAMVICELLGVPYGDREDFQRLAMARFDVLGGAMNTMGAISESLDYLGEVVRRQRREPGDGLIGGIIREHGAAVGDEELAGLADGVLTGGFETTASMLSLGALALMRDRDTMRRIAVDESAVNPFVEELLRHLAVVQVAFPRFARHDHELAGAAIGKGDIVVVSLTSANRDAVLGNDLEGIDASRRPTAHLAFGHGLHRCVGAELARMELRAAFPALAREFPGLRLAIPAEELAFRKASIVYGVDSLPVHTSV